MTDEADLRLVVLPQRRRTRPCASHNNILLQTRKIVSQMQKSTCQPAGELDRKTLTRRPAFVILIPKLYQTFAFVGGSVETLVELE